MQSRSANAVFALVTEHTFRGLMYDTYTRTLHAKLTIYGFVPNKLPSNYSGYFSAATAAAATASAYDVVQNSSQPPQPMPILLSTNGSTIDYNLNRIILFLYVIFILYAYA